MDTADLKAEMIDAMAKVNRRLRTVFDARVKERGLTWRGRAPCLP